MGYNTEFRGELLFTEDITGEQIDILDDILGEDCRDHEEWDAGELTHMDLEFNDDFSGIRWNHSEKTYDLEHKINLLLALMRKRWPSFGLEGSLSAQGQDMDDRWDLVMENGVAVMKTVNNSVLIACPNCNHKFERYT